MTASEFLARVRERLETKAENCAKRAAERPNKAGAYLERRAAVLFAVALVASAKPKSRKRIDLQTA